MADPGNTFDLRTTEVDVWTLRLGYHPSLVNLFSNTGGYVSIRTNATRAACYLEGDPDTMYDFYFVTQDCNVNFSMDPALKLVGAQYDIEALTIPEDTFLEDSQPDTSVGSTQFTTGISKTYSGSFGFFGDTATGNVSASVTYSESKTISIPDVQIKKLSNDSGANAKWHYILNKDAAIATSELSVFNCALWRVKNDPTRERGFIMGTTVTIELYGPANLLGLVFAATLAELDANNLPGPTVRYDPDYPAVANELRQNPIGGQQMADGVMQQPCTAYITLPRHMVGLPEPKPAPKPGSKAGA